jgi:hypothetical protein
VGIYSIGQCCNIGMVSPVVKKSRHNMPETTLNPEIKSPIFDEGLSQFRWPMLFELGQKKDGLCQFSLM